MRAFLRVNSCPLVVDLRGSPILWPTKRVSDRRRLRIDLRKSSNPTSHCFCGISGLRVEAESCVRSMFMHEVNQFLEQDEVSWNHADARANHDAVKLLLFELGQNDRFRSLTKIGQANARVVANRFQ